MQSWKQAQQTESQSNEVVAGACNHKAAVRLAAFVPKLMQKAVSQPRLQSHVHNRNECCVRLAKWLEETVLSNRHVSESVSTHQQILEVPSPQTQS